jgi:ubiquinone/menaquinone biosynthesis methyltransferase
MSGKPVADVHGRNGTTHGDDVRGMFDAIAPTYDTLNHLLSAGIDVRWRKKAVARLGQKRLPAGDLLDLCAGTMDLTKMLADQFPGRGLVAADFAKNMLDRGASKVPAADRVVADAMQLPFETERFAGTICGFGIRNVAETRKALVEVFRCSKPGAAFVTLEFFKPTRFDTRLFHGAYAKVVLPTVGGALSGEGWAYKYLAKSMEGFLTRKEFEALLREVGFVNVTGEELLFGIASIVRAEVPR